ncbi:hypothetical protein R3P38DRAFT_1374740 [Favolaschia claudopus]|uniref:Uncharacterized protein n=1 Tax=Favolaschia claudopus TaxID=2862362 RepID=A0AAW0DWM9_9AGAR
MMVKNRFISDGPSFRCGHRLKLDTQVEIFKPSALVVSLVHTERDWDMCFRFIAGWQASSEEGKDSSCHVRSSGLGSPIVSSGTRGACTIVPLLQTLSSGGCAISPLTLSPPHLHAAAHRSADAPGYVPLYAALLLPMRLWRSCAYGARDTLAGGIPDVLLRSWWDDKAVLADGTDVFFVVLFIHCGGCCAAGCGCWAGKR